MVTLDPLLSRFSEQNDKDKKLDATDNILVIGSSIIKYVYQVQCHQTVKTKVFRGGCIRDVQHFIHGEQLLVHGAQDDARNVSTGDLDLKSFSRIVVQIGSNDIDTGGQGSLIMKDFEELFENLKACGDQKVTISSPLVRLNNPRYMNTLRKVNSSLHLLCDQYGFEFIDNEPAFTLKNEKIDDSVFEDNVHIDKKGTERLIENWGIEVLRPNSTRNKTNVVGAEEMMELPRTIKCKPRDAWVTALEMIDGISKSIEKEKIDQVVPRSKGVWIVSTKDNESYEILINKGFSLRDDQVLCTDIKAVYRPTVCVRVTDAPCQLQDEKLLDILSPYGVIQKINRLCHPGTRINNGELEVYMTVKMNIPKFIPVARNVVLGISYEGQRLQCKNCGDTSHFAGKCPHPRPCYICKQLGHNGPDCKLAKECYKCGKKGHLKRHCKNFENKENEPNRTEQKSVKVNEKITEEESAPGSTKREKGSSVPSSTTKENGGEDSRETEIKTLRKRNRELEEQNATLNASIISLDQKVLPKSQSTPKNPKKKTKK